MNFFANFFTLGLLTCLIARIVLIASIDFLDGLTRLCLDSAATTSSNSSMSEEPLQSSHLNWLGFSTLGRRTLPCLHSKSVNSGCSSMVCPLFSCILRWNGFNPSSPTIGETTLSVLELMTRISLSTIYDSMPLIIFLSRYPDLEILPIPDSTVDLLPPIEVRKYSSGSIPEE